MVSTIWISITAVAPPVHRLLQNSSARNDIPKGGPSNTSCHDPYFAPRNAARRAGPSRDSNLLQSKTWTRQDLDAFLACGALPLGKVERDGGATQVPRSMVVEARRKGCRTPHRLSHRAHGHWLGSQQPVFIQMTSRSRLGPFDGEPNAHGSRPCARACANLVAAQFSPVLNLAHSNSSYGETRSSFKPCGGVKDCQAAA